MKKIKEISPLILYGIDGDNILELVTTITKFYYVFDIIRFEEYDMADLLLYLEFKYPCNNHGQCNINTTNNKCNYCIINIINAAIEDNELALYEKED